MISVFPLTKNWAEGSSNGGTGANWCYGDRTGPTLPWNVYGADGQGIDRGPPAGSANFQDQAALAAKLDPLQLGNWIDLANSELNVLVVATSGAKLFFYSKEHPTSKSSAASLTFTICE